MFIAKRRDRDHCRKTAAIFTNIGQLVNVFDAARSFKYQGLETRRNRCGKFDAQSFRTGDHFRRIRNIGRRDLVHHIGSGIAEHALSTDVENLNDTFGVGGNARKIGTIENGALQSTCFKQCSFGLLACGVVGTNQKISDNIF